jgi:eukaryotic-like serine/threonine-protein kinase
MVAALERPAGERRAFLERACGGDEILRREVERLIESHEAAGDFLERPALAVFELPALAALGGGSDEEQVEDGLDGSLLGSYRLVRAIGRGGMGVVYLATRSDDAFEKRVAIKLVKRGMDTDEVLRRFARERRILAALDHPHIARLLDAGTTPGGLPYFVMEHVEGRPILEYCEARRLSTTERLKLFRDVCSAVAFAHQNLVVHRDLKPSNILVDEAGVVRLLDFGIAKLLSDSEGADDPASKTGTGLRPMTPRYSSPEQVRGEPIATSSDVYSLGVLLYELMTGRSPYRSPASPSSSFSAADLERAICEEEPEKPSAAVGRELRRRLAGDVDTIVLLALHKDPRRRYGSVERLSEDVRRHLEGLPIAARKDTLLYRGGKFLRRHAVGAAVAAVCVLLAAGAIATMAVQRARIERERLKAEQISGFLAGLFRGSDPREARGSPLTVREMLDRGSARIERELAREPEVQATLMQTIGRTYQEIGAYDAATRMLDGAYRIRRGLFGERSLPVAESLQSLGDLRIATGKLPDAEKSLKAALAVRRDILGPDDVAVAQTMRSLAKIVRRRDPAEAESILRSALAIQTNRLGERDPELADTWNALGVTALVRGDYDAAESSFRKALEVDAAAESGGGGRDRPDAAKHRSNLGAALILEGKFREAVPLYREVAADEEKLFGEDHPVHAAGLVNLAQALDLDGKSEEAEALCRRALAIGKRVVGGNHPDLVFVWNTLATILREKGDMEGAEAAAREGLALAKPSLPEGHPLLAESMLAMGAARLARHDAAGAEEYLRPAAEIRTRNLRSGDWSLAEAQSLLGACLTARGRYDEAADLLAKSYDVEKARLGPRHAHTLTTLGRLAALFEARGDAARASAYRAELAGTAASRETK